MRYFLYPDQEAVLQKVQQKDRFHSFSLVITKAIMKPESAQSVCGRINIITV